MTCVVIGGGWSGLAAAVTLCQRGHDVHLVEFAKQLGGRARNVEWNGKVVDNGQHMMIGAYRHMLEMMDLIDINETDVFNRHNIDISIYDTEYPRLNLSANNCFPWPLSLAWSLIRSASISEFIAIARLQRSIPNLLENEDKTVKEWLHQQRQSPRLVKQLWESLCLATLNTPIKEASAHLLAIVVRDSLSQTKSAADLLIPKVPLGDLFPQAAAKYIYNNGGKISLQTKVDSLLCINKRITAVTTKKGDIEADQVIVATGPNVTSQLLSEIINFETPKHYPIATVYLQFAESFRLPIPMFGMTGTLSQWAFDRSDQHPGLIAIVISGPGPHEKMTNKQLFKLVVAELQSALKSDSNVPLDHFIIKEKRATFVSVKNIAATRPSYTTPIEGLWLAGDYALNNYPATLEGAILNGKRCAELVDLNH